MSLASGEFCCLGVRLTWQGGGICRTACFETGPSMNLSSKVAMFPGLQQYVSDLSETALGSLAIFINAAFASAGVR